MKNFKIILFSFFLCFLNFWNTYANEPDFVVNGFTELNNVAVETQLSFQITAVWWNIAKNYTLSLPSWFQYLSHSIWWSCENTQIIGGTNTSFNYTFESVNPVCVSAITVNYEVLATAKNGINTITLLNPDIVKSVVITVTNNITITQAITRDTNQNGFIDRYELTFSRNVDDNSFDTNKLTVWSLSGILFETGNTPNDTQGFLVLPENTFHTGETPQIISGSGEFLTDIWILNNNSILEKDGSIPIVKQINNTNFWTWNIAIGTGSFSFTLSESLPSASLDFINIKKSESLINGTFNISGTNITFTPLSSLDPGIYNIVFWSWSNDASGNKVKDFTQNLSVTITQNQACSSLPTNAQWNSVSSILQTLDGINPPQSTVWIYNTTQSTTSCHFICNSGYNWNGSSCIRQSSGWWGGWGWGWWGGGISIIPTCTLAQLECRNGIYVIQPNQICSGWDFWKTCTITKPTDILWDDFSDFVKENNENEEEIKFITLELFIEFVESKYSQSTQNILNQYTKGFERIEKEYFLLKDKNFAKQYQDALVSYKKFADAVEAYQINKTQENLTKLQDSLKDFQETQKNISNPIEKFVTQKTDTFWNEIFVTKDQKIIKTFQQIEKAWIGKFQRQLQAKVISQSEYESVIQDYNTFVAYITIYRSNKDKSIIPLLQKSINNIWNTYKKRIPRPISTPPVIQVKKVSDVYPLQNVQRLTAYNDEVKNLQLILKHFGYFEFEATGYFGNTTNNLLQKFVEEKLLMTYPWFLSQEIIEKINNLTY